MAVRRMRELVGLPVLDGSQGRKAGAVSDVLFDEWTDVLLGVLTDPVRRGGLWLAREDIESIGPPGVVGTISLCPGYGSRWSEKVGTRVRERDGLLRGMVADVYVDDGFREVLGYEIAGSLFTDWPDERPVMVEKGTLMDTDTEEVWKNLYQNQS